MEKAKLLSFGLGGNGIDYAPNEHGSTSHSSWYLSPEKFDNYVESHYSETDFEDCVVLDKRAVLEEHPELAFTMPMVDVTLPDGGANRLGDRNTLKGMIPGLGGAFKSLAVMAQSEQYHGLDYVARDVFVELWRKQGARVGRMVDRHIVWEE